jgi:hypothetical protein
MAACVALTPLTGLAAPAAQQSTTKTAKAKAAPKAQASEHVTTGTVKSMDATTMVITRSGKSHAEMAFDLGPSVQREGNVAVGSNVSIRYHENGNKHVATAITVKRSA